MSSLTAGQLTNLRTNLPHTKQTYLSPIPRVTLLTGLVADPAIVQGAMTIAYDNGTGTAAQFALIEAGQTVLLGTVAEGEDLGRGRVVSVAGTQVAGTLSVAWNYDIDWADNMHLTVLHLYELWPLFPRFTVTPEVFYKDYDIAYTDENTDRKPVAIMGPPWAGFLVAGTVTVVIDGQNSYAMATGATIAAYAWSVTTAVLGAAPAITNAAIATTDITFDTAGLYWVKLVVTDDNGKTQSTLRPFVVHDASNLPYYIEAASRTEGWLQGSTSLSFTVSGDADETTIPPKTPVVLWSDNQCAGVVAELARMREDEYVDREHIDFFGYITEVDTSMTPVETGLVSFKADTVDRLLDQRLEYPVALIADRSITGAVVDDWWKFPNTELTAANAVHHLWRWHSTLFEIADVHLPTGNTLLRAGCEEFTEGSLLDRAKSFVMEHGIFANVMCNPYGVMYVEVDVQMLDTADRAAVTDIFTITTTDWREEISIALRQDRPVAMAYLSGGKWDGSRFTPLLSKWGTIANQEGAQVVVADRLMASSQTNLNELCGRVVSISNDGTEEIRFTLAGNWSSAVGVAPQEWVRFTLTGTEAGNNREVVYSNIRAKIIQVSTEFNSNLGVSETSMIVVPEAFDRDGIDGDYPDGGDDGEYGDYDDPDPPQWPIPITYGASGALLAGDSTNGVWFTPESQSEWQERNTGKIADTEEQTGWDPWWPTAEKQNTSDPNFAIVFSLQVGVIYRSVDCGQTWVDVTPVTDPPNDWGDAPPPTVADLTFVQRADNIHLNGAHYVIAEWMNGAGDWRGWLLKTEDDGLTWDWGDSPLTTNVNECAECGPTPCFSDGLCGVGCGSGDLTPETGWRTLSSTITLPGMSACADDGLPSHRIQVVFDSRRYISTRNAVGLNDCGVNLLRAWQCQAAVYVLTLSTNITTQANMEIDRIVLTSTDPFTIEMNIAATVPNPLEEIRPFWMDVDSEDGSTLWLTVWREGDLILQEWDTADLTLENEYDLGACNKAEMTAGTYQAYPYTPTYDKDIVYVFGRMQNPQGLGNPSHVIVTTDGGATFNLVEGAWAADVCTALRVEGDADGSRISYGIRSDAADVPKLYVGTETVLTYVSDLILAVGVYVNVDALTVHPDGTVACGGDTANAVMVIQTPSPHTTWEDITNNFPITGGVRSLTYV